MIELSPKRSAAMTRTPTTQSADLCHRCESAVVDYRTKEPGRDDLLVWCSVCFAKHYDPDRPDRINGTADIVFDVIVGPPPAPPAVTPSGPMSSGGRRLLRLSAARRDAGGLELPFSGSNTPRASSGASSHAVQHLGKAGRSGVPTRRSRRSEPADPSTTDATIEARIAAATVNPGWTPENWAARLEQMAGLCAPLHPELADQLRRWAAAVRERHCPPASRWK